MRVKETRMNIDYRETKSFFKKRANKFKQDNPYSVTMYQDHNEKLVRERNKKELDKLLPLLKIEPETKLLDVACGIGRWADALPDTIEEYCGVDFSEDLIKIANERNVKERFDFCVGTANQIEYILKKNEKGKFNRVLVVGIIMYLNDDDVKNMLEQIERCCEKHAIICMREPIGLDERLTLKDFYSEELGDNYNAIYRTREEWYGFMEETLLKKGFHVSKEGFLFEEDVLNNRKETRQYYYILERS